MNEDQKKLYDHLCDLMKKDSCSKETHMLLELIQMLWLSGPELDMRMNQFFNDYMPALRGIRPGDECYYVNGDGDSRYENRFIVTRVYEDLDGDGLKTRYFDAIYHDGRTISDGTLRLIDRTGNYYPIMKVIASPFDPQNDDCEETE